MQRYLNIQKHSTDPSLQHVLLKLILSLLYILSPQCLIEKPKNSSEWAGFAERLSSEFVFQGLMAQAVGRNVAAPLLFLNLLMYLIVLGLASWCLNHFINGQTHYGGVAGNGATFYFMVFAILAGVLGVTSKLAGGYHLRAWRNDSLASAAPSALIAWAVTALAFGLACKEIHVGGYRGWRLRALEAFVIILTFTQLLYVMLLHAGMMSSKYGPGYRDPDYGAQGLEAPKGVPRV